MSEEIPERNEIVRSSIITVFFTALFLTLAIAFWVWSSPGIDSPVAWLNKIHGYIAPALEILIMFLFFVFLLTTEVNLRLYATHIRAGWLEIIFIFIVVVALAWFMFLSTVATFTAIFSLAFIGYIYLLQE